MKIRLPEVHLSQRKKKGRDWGAKPNPMKQTNNIKVSRISTKKLQPKLVMKT